MRTLRSAFDGVVMDNERAISLIMIVTLAAGSTFEDLVEDSKLGFGIVKKDHLTAIERFDN